MPTVAIPVEELLARFRAERAGPPGTPPPDPRQPAHHRRPDAGYRPLSSPRLPGRQPSGSWQAPSPYLPKGPRPPSDSLPPSDSRSSAVPDQPSGGEPPPAVASDSVPEPRSRPRARGIVVRARDPGRGARPGGHRSARHGSGGQGGGANGDIGAVGGTGSGGPGDGGPGDGGGTVSAASTLWLLAAIVVLFATAVVLLAITVRSLCLTTALPT